MKRLLIFAILGPPLGLVTGACIMLPLLNWALGEPGGFDYHQVVLLPAAYMIGILPALVAGGFDAAMANRRWRILWTTLFAFAASFIPLLTAFGAGFIHGPFILLFGIVGAVPGAICSAIAGRGESRSDDRRSA